jgi:hypothetical protein
MDNSVLRVGMREFRANLPQYLLASSPVAVTRHGETVGFYIPAQHPAEKMELSALEKAALQFDQLLAANNLDEDELLLAFRTLREGRH